MGIFRLEREDHQFLKSQLGQSTIEYIMLLAVVVSLATLFFKSAAFKNFFGENSTFFNAIQGRMEVAYRHAYIFPLEDEEFSYAAPHKSFSVDGSQSRFFIGVNAYE